MNSPIQALQPNLIDINAHLHALFHPGFTHSYPNSYIQIAYGPPSTGNVNQAQIWSAHDLKGAAEFAAKKNADGFNVYVSPALLQFDGEPPPKRVKDDRYLTSAFAWVEFDGEGDAERINNILKEKQILPALIVKTGSTPHLRMHIYFKVDGIRDAEQQKQVNKAMQNLLGTDTVIDACRVMRLAGTVNYPTKKKSAERGYIAEVTTFRKVSDALTYRVEQLLALAPDDDLRHFADYSTWLEENIGLRIGKSDDDVIAMLQASKVAGQWHTNMRNAIASMVGKRWPEMAIKAMCSPFSEGGFDDKDVAKLIDSAVQKYGAAENERETAPVQEMPKPKASSALALTYYDELCDAPRKFWIMKRVLARGETSNWFGPPGVGKSVLMTDLAFHVAWGRDWRGYRSKERCGVVYIALERGALVKRRLSAYKRKHEAPDLPIAVASNVVDLKNKACVKLIVDTIREAEARFGVKVGLIVIDTISKGIAAGGGDEDKAKDVNIVLANLRRVEELTNVHIACVGHTGKDEGRGHRGSNANLGDVDLMVQISGDGAIKTAKVIKINDGTEGPLTHYKIDSALLSTDEDGDAITTAIISDDAAEATQDVNAKKGLNRAQSRAIELLTRCINEIGRPPPTSQEFPRNVRVVTLEEWHAACERGGLSSAKEKADRDRAFRRAKDDLQTFKRIACLDGLVWLVRDDG
ncbi:AAA family ATPase [Bradyrhizobium sp. DOA9]|uniref:AAA family ATPase n=1 Tax=Bradyrhizobium sp. DOA9 TaxID=1126627 RepID=UPI000469A5C1|nr:AAA family ATPase [Bradyrhizobium sp. DOA9]GAJ36103.1 hypothetical protein BDOA9_0153160 [Bradyrhizobium sp. DOA9]